MSSDDDSDGIPPPPQNLGGTGAFNRLGSTGRFRAVSPGGGGGSTTLTRSPAGSSAAQSPTSPQTSFRWDRAQSFRLYATQSRGLLSRRSTVGALGDTIGSEGLSRSVAELSTHGGGSSSSSPVHFSAASSPSLQSTAKQCRQAIAALRHYLQTHGVTIAAPVAPPPAADGSHHGDKGPLFGGQHVYAAAAAAAGGGDIIKGPLIGTGGYAMVYAGADTSTNEVVAIKEIQMGPADKRTALKDIEDEFALLQRLRHRNVVRYSFFDFSHSRRLCRIVLEFMAAGSLQGLLARCGAFDEAVLRRVAEDILRGLDFIHGEGIVHRDIKPANILVSERGVAKLADFGCSKRISEVSAATSHLLGTPVYMAPEVIKGRGQSMKADVWAAGCTLFEMATGLQPWHHTRIRDHLPLMFYISTTSESPMILPSAFDRCFSADFASFLDACFERDPDRRPDASALLQHRWIVTGDPAGTQQLERTCAEVCAALCQTLVATGRGDGSGSAGPSSLQPSIVLMQQRHGSAGSSSILHSGPGNPYQQPSTMSTTGSSSPSAAAMTTGSLLVPTPAQFLGGGVGSSGGRTPSPGQSPRDPAIATPADFGLPAKDAASQRGSVRSVSSVADHNNTNLAHPAPNPPSDGSHSPHRAGPGPSPRHMQQAEFGFAATSILSANGPPSASILLPIVQTQQQQQQQHSGHHQRPSGGMLAAASCASLLSIATPAATPPASPGAAAKSVAETIMARRAGNSTSNTNAALSSGSFHNVTAGTTAVATASTTNFNFAAAASVAAADVQQFYVLDEDHDTFELVTATAGGEIICVGTAPSAQQLQRVADHFRPDRRSSGAMSGGLGTTRRRRGSGANSVVSGHTPSFVGLVPPPGHMEQLQGGAGSGQGAPIRRGGKARSFFRGRPTRRSPSTSRHNSPRGPSLSPPSSTTCHLPPPTAGGSSSAANTSVSGIAYSNNNSRSVSPGMFSASSTATLGLASATGAAAGMPQEEPRRRTSRGSYFDDLDPSPPNAAVSAFSSALSAADTLRGAGGTSDAEASPERRGSSAVGPNTTQPPTAAPDQSPLQPQPPSHAQQSSPHRSGSTSSHPPHRLADSVRDEFSSGRSSATATPTARSPNAATLLSSDVPPHLHAPHSRLHAAQPSTLNPSTVTTLMGAGGSSGGARSPSTNSTGSPRFQGQRQAFSRAVRRESDDSAYACSTSEAPPRVDIHVASSGELRADGSGDHPAAIAVDPETLNRAVPAAESTDYTDAIAAVVASGPKYIHLSMGRTTFGGGPGGPPSAQAARVRLGIELTPEDISVRLINHKPAFVLTMSDAVRARMAAAFADHAGAGDAASDSPRGPAHAHQSEGSAPESAPRPHPHPSANPPSTARPDDDDNPVENLSFSVGSSRRSRLRTQQSADGSPLASGPEGGRPGDDDDEASLSTTIASASASATQGAGLSRRRGVGSLNRTRSIAKIEILADDDAPGSVCATPRTVLLPMSPPAAAVAHAHKEPHGPPSFQQANAHSLNNSFSVASRHNSTGHWPQRHPNPTRGGMGSQHRGPDGASDDDGPTSPPPPRSGHHSARSRAGTTGPDAVEGAYAASSAHPPHPQEEMTHFAARGGTRRDESPTAARRRRRPRVPRRIYDSIHSDDTAAAGPVVPQGSAFARANRFDHDADGFDREHTMGGTEADERGMYGDDDDNAYSGSDYEGDAYDDSEEDLLQDLAADAEDEDAEGQFTTFASFCFTAAPGPGVGHNEPSTDEGPPQRRDSEGSPLTAPDAAAAQGAPAPVLRKLHK